MDANYEKEIRRLVCAVVTRIAGRRPPKDIVEELTSQGWYIALEMLDDYNPTQSKLTTFLWSNLNGRLLRYANKIKDLQNQNSGIDPAQISNIEQDLDYWMEPDPYHQTPEQFCTQSEINSLWERLQQRHRNLLSRCLERTPKHSNCTMRQKYSRSRRNNILKLKHELMEQLE